MGRTRLDRVSQDQLIKQSTVIAVAKFIESDVVRHPHKDKGDPEYKLNCCHFEIVEIIKLDKNIKHQKGFKIDLSPGAKILVAPSDSSMYHSGFVHHKKTGGYRSFAVDIYRDSNEPMSKEESYIVYAQACSLNPELLEFSARESLDPLSHLDGVRKQLSEPVTEHPAPDDESSD